MTSKKKKPVSKNSKGLRDVVSNAAKEQEIQALKEKALNDEAIKMTNEFITSMKAKGFRTIVGALRGDCSFQIGSMTVTEVLGICEYVKQSTLGVVRQSEAIDHNIQTLERRPELLLRLVKLFR